MLHEGMPVYIHDDGKEAPFDAAATVAAIRARNAEAKAHRERAEAAESKLKGLGNPRCIHAFMLETHHRKHGCFR